MNDLLKILEAVANLWGQETVQAILKKIDTTGIKWNGSLRRSIMYSQKGTNIEFDMADYGKFIDEGVNGTLIKRGSPFSFKGKVGGTAAAIKPWATSKGLNEWAVAKSIQKKGIKKRPFFKSVIEFRAPSLEKAITKATEDYIKSKLKP